MGEGQCARVTTIQIHGLLLQLVTPDKILIPAKQDDNLSADPEYKIVYPSMEDVIDALYELGFEKKITHSDLDGFKVLWLVRLINNEFSLTNEA